LPEAGWSEGDGPKEELADHVVELFARNKDMLDDYFSLQIETIGGANRAFILSDPNLHGSPNGSHGSDQQWNRNPKTANLNVTIKVTIPTPQRNYFVLLPVLDPFEILL
jgi:hypothetical protein